MGPQLKPQIPQEYVMRATVMAQCVGSFAYWLDAFAHIEDRATQQAIPFKLWPGQLEVLPLIEESSQLLVLKARQLGLTWLVAAYCLWRALFHRHELVVVVSKNESLAQEFLERVLFIFDRLPSWMRPRAKTRNTTQITFAYDVKDAQGGVTLGGLQSTIKSIPSTPDAGQSKTISLLVIDEAALIQYLKSIWSAAQPTLEHAAGQVIFLSNPSKDKPGWPFYRELYTLAMKGRNKFQRLFLSWDCVPGRGEDFIDNLKDEGWTDDDIAMQYPTTEAEAVSAMLGSYFGSTIAKFIGYSGESGYLSHPGNEDIQAGTKPEFVPSTSAGAILEVWDHPVPHWEWRYVIGADIGKGTGYNYSVAYVYDRHINQYVARMRSNQVAPDVWADRLIELARYYNDALIGPERNGPGITTVRRLQLSNYWHLYFRERPGQVKAEVTHQYGWLETQESKQLLVDELKRYYREICVAVPCTILLDESSTFIQHENGKLEAEDGKFDDCVIAAGISLQIGIGLPAPVYQPVKEMLTQAEADRAVVTGALPAHKTDGADMIAAMAARWNLFPDEGDHSNGSIRTYS